MPSVGTCPFPSNTEDNDCDRYSRYRTIDGSCNNMRRPLWGKSFTNLVRLLPPDYADGIGEPRVSRSGNFLPSARSVSLTIFRGTSNQQAVSHVHTVMLQTFGQFLDHDLDRTAITKLTKDKDGMGEEMVDVKCGESECETDGAENAACLPMYLPKYDPDFPSNRTCLMFVRSQEVLRDDCSLAPREQLNQITSYLDASHIYGSDMNQSKALRDVSMPQRGRLLVTPHPFNPSFKELLPQKENKDCRDFNSTAQCFTAGDGRVNEQVGLMSMHTIFHRGHNTIEGILNSLNPHWDGETLFQESRRIMWAAWQHIVYNEYLPITLGPALISKYGLKLYNDGYFNAYDDTVDASAANVFATAAFRFGHSQIGDMIRFSSQLFAQFKEVEFSKVFNRPGQIYTLTAPGGASGVDSVILGMLSQRTDDADRFFSKEVTSKLFSDNTPKMPGTDLTAINVQRGRDHGIPSYNEWREWCGLRRASDFSDLTDIEDEDVRYKLRTLYESVDDIDVYVGGMSERHVAGSTVGPLFGCIIGRQFRASRVGDRFWYERDDPTVGFTPGQLQEIRKFTFAHIICQNLDKVDTIQKFVMLQPFSEVVKTLGSNWRDAYSLASLYHGDNNERRPCSSLPQPDFTQWRDYKRSRQ